MGSIPASRTRQIKTRVLSSQHCHAAACCIPTLISTNLTRSVSLLARDATSLCAARSKTPLTPLPLSLYKLPSAPTADIKIDIETAEKLIGEIIVQPLR
ncbi:hypothetical protein [Janthinobacterium sp. UMAB-56]|uniref:hypothetical protein n=1 Tax=Janthinobacterium sp. UMAB-56 TaxID=1365361 RepID=UPI001C55B3EA|nr:hypothetical protein [Janthinobacterium sp. UMAB-56]